ncbi:MAG TPA: CBS domain-containing protein [Actinomycetota bacterium]|jgi:CBS domain-containing protein|nr:CBS domain-containing protein [Actinomycetota bacterium]
MKVGDIMTTEVTTASPDDTFVHIAGLLHEGGISSIVVMQGDEIAGIVTERDLVNLVADGADPGSVTVGERMTRDLDTVEPKTDIAEAAEHMARLKIRHLPVVERGSLVGIVSIRDLINWAVAELTTGHELPDLQRSATALTAAVEINRPLEP